LYETPFEHLKELATTNGWIQYPKSRTWRVMFHSKPTLELIR
jgi:hypothetical protein